MLPKMTEEQLNLADEVILRQLLTNEGYKPHHLLGRAKLVSMYLERQADESVSMRQDAAPVAHAAAAPAEQLIPAAPIAPVAPVKEDAQLDALKSRLARHIAAGLKVSINRADNTWLFTFGTKIDSGTLAQPINRIVACADYLVGRARLAALDEII